MSWKKNYISSLMDFFYSLHSCKINVKCQDCYLFCYYLVYSAFLFSKLLSSLMITWLPGIVVMANLFLLGGFLVIRYPGY